MSRSYSDYERLKEGRDELIKNKLIKTYLVNSDTNYGLMIHIVNANTKEEARDMAIKEGAWDVPLYDVIEIDTETVGVVWIESPRGG